MIVDSILKGAVASVALAAIIVAFQPHPAGAEQLKTCNATVSKCCECSIDGGAQVCESTSATIGVDTCVIGGTTCPSGNTCDRNT